MKQQPYYAKRALYAWVKKCSQTEVPYPLPLNALNDIQLSQFNNALECLKKGVPLARITGEREFWSLTFALNQETLDPRPDSECLIESIKKVEPSTQKNLRFLDLGTGSGCLLLALLKEYKNSTGDGVDIAKAALEAAQQNAKHNELYKRAHFYQSHWLSNVKGHYDIIVSNPPYISETEFLTLDENVKNYDPYGALVAGPLGTECYDQILKALAKKLVTFDHLFIEINTNLDKEIAQLVADRGFRLVQIFCDLEGRARVFHVRSHTR